MDVVGDLVPGPVVEVPDLVLVLDVVRRHVPLVLQLGLEMGLDLVKILSIFVERLKEDMFLVWAPELPGASPLAVVGLLCLRNGVVRALFSAPAAATSSLFHRSLADPGGRGQLLPGGVGAGGQGLAIGVARGLEAVAAILAIFVSDWCRKNRYITSFCTKYRYQELMSGSHFLSEVQRKTFSLEYRKGRFCGSLSGHEALLQKQR